MDKKVGVLALLLSAMFGGCSSDESVINEGGENNGQVVGYIAVNIVQPKSAGVRATGFEYGEGEENKASNALFFIFNASDELVGAPKEVSHLDGSGTSTSPHPEVERIYNEVLVIDGVNSDPTVDSKKLVCVLNAPTEVKDKVNALRQDGRKLTITDLKGLIGNYGNCSDGTFIMSNSVYTSNGNIAADISDNIRKSEPEASAHPVNVYVERVVARVEASVEDGKTIVNKGAKVQIGTTKQTLGIKVTGIEIANIADESYLFKSVDGVTEPQPTTGLWSANFWDATNMRSYWETVPDVNEPITATKNVVSNEKLDFKNKSYTDIATPTDFDINKKDLLKEYIQPNTSDTKTCVLVTAQLTKDGNPIKDLAYIRGGYTTIDDALKVVATHLAETKNWYKETTVTTETTTETTYTQLEPEDFVWKNKNNFEGDAKTEVSSWLKDYEVVAQLKSGEGAITKIYNRNGDPIEDGVNKVNTYLRAKTDADAIAKNYCARVFTDGKCYYFVDIDHSDAVGADLGTHYGVVRNHIYRLTLESIGGIGTPVFDPDDIIIPQTPEGETSFYLSAKVNVLAWKLVKQEIAFGESDTPSTGN